MSSYWPSSATYALILGALACEGPLKNGEVLDTPLISVSGTITPPPDGAPLALGVLWVDPIQSGSHASGSELVADSIGPEGGFTMELYSPPPDSTVRWLKASETGEVATAFAWGEIVLYEDRDENGTFGVGPIAEGSPILGPDVYRGTATAHILVYVARAQDLRQTLIPGVSAVLLEEGYRVGAIQCRPEGHVPNVFVAAPKDVLVELAAPSVTFPGLRDCLTTWVSGPVTSQ